MKTEATKNTRHADFMLYGLLYVIGAPLASLCFMLAILAAAYCHYYKQSAWHAANSACSDLFEAVQFGGGGALGASIIAFTHIAGFGAIIAVGLWATGRWNSKRIAAFWVANMIVTLSL